MLSRCSRVNTAQCITGLFGESFIPISLLFEELHESGATKGAAPDQMLRQYPLGIGPSRTTRRLAEYRPGADTLPLAVTLDGPARWEGMEGKLVVLPTQRAAKLVYCCSNEADEVLKCLDLGVYATLSFDSAWAFENPPRHADAHAIFLARQSSGHRRGKLPWRQMLCYSGELGKD